MMSRFGRLKLQPRAAAGDQLGPRQVAAGRAIRLGRKIDARRTDQLRYDHALAAIDDKSRRVSHQWEVTHKDFLLGDLTGFPVQQLYLHPQRRGERDVTFAAFLFRVFRLAKIEIAKVQLQRLIKGRNRRDLGEQLLETLILKPFEAVQLHFRQARQLEYGWRARVILACHPPILRVPLISVSGSVHGIQLLLVPKMARRHLGRKVPTGASPRLSPSTLRCLFPRHIPLRFVIDLYPAKNQASLQVR